MRFGLTISILVHAALLLAGFVLANARLMEAVPSEPIAVEIVSDRELAAKEPARAAEDKADRKSSPDSDPAAEKMAGRSEGTAMPPDRPASRNDTPDTFAAAPLYLPMLQGLDSADLTFETPADTGAKVSSDDLAAFRAHLQQCWQAPDGLNTSGKLQAVLRVGLRRDGTLGREPLLVQASAAVQGPLLVETAIKAVRRCQPFTSLPADKYEEWKLLDLRFTPLGLAAAEGTRTSQTR